MLVIVIPNRMYLADLVRQQFPGEDLELVVDRRRGERRVNPDVAMPGDRRKGDRRRHDIQAELEVTGWAIVRPAPHRLHDPTQSWHLPWLRTQLLLRMLLRTRWDAAVWPTARAALREAIATHRRVRREGWFN